MLPLEVSAMNETWAPDKQTAAAAYASQAAISTGYYFHTQQKLQTPSCNFMYLIYLANLSAGYLSTWSLRAFMSEQWQCSESLYEHLQAFEPHQWWAYS